MKGIKYEGISILTLKNKDDLEILAEGYANLYNNSVLKEKWTQQTALKLLEYFYKLCPDLFLVAYYNEKPIGAIMSGIKPWWDGVHLEDTEVFVLKDYQKMGIATKLYKQHFKLAIKKYGATTMEAHTYSDEKGFPLNWYKNLGFEIVNDWKIINGNILKLLEKL